MGDEADDLELRQFMGCERVGLWRTRLDGFWRCGHDAQSSENGLGKMVSQGRMDLSESRLTRTAWPPMPTNTTTNRI